MVFLAPVSPGLLLPGALFLLTASSLPGQARVANSRITSKWTFQLIPLNPAPAPPLNSSTWDGHTPKVNLPFDGCQLLDTSWEPHRQCSYHGPHSGNWLVDIYICGGPTLQQPNTCPQFCSQTWGCESWVATWQGMERWSTRWWHL